MASRRLARIWAHCCDSRSVSTFAGEIQVLVCSNVKGLLPALENGVKKHPNLPPISWVQCTPAELQNGPSQTLWKECEILLADPGLVVGMLPEATRLKWMQSTWAGVESLFQISKSLPSFRLSRLGGVFGPLMAEYVMGYVLLWERKFLSALELQRKHEWQQQTFVPGIEGNPRTLRGMTLGILGYGDISAQVARCAQAFGMNVIAFRKRKIDVESKDIQITHDLHAVLRSADYLVNVLPSTELTRGMLAGDTFQHCAVVGKRPPVFINVGRGSVTDETALLKALEQKWLGGAVLDVFPKEPLPSSSPLWSHPRILITPHISAPSFAEDTASLFLENLGRFRAGESLKFEVNWANGY